MLVRIWDMELGADQEPPSAAEAMDEVTTVAPAVRGQSVNASHLLSESRLQAECWLSGSKDGDVRRYEKFKPGSDAKPALEGLVTSAHGVSIRCVAPNPDGKRVAVTSE